MNHKKLLEKFLDSIREYEIKVDKRISDDNRLSSFFVKQFLERNEVKKIIKNENQDK